MKTKRKMILMVGLVFINNLCAAESKRVVISPAKSWSYPKVVNVDRFNGRSTPLRQTRSPKCPFRQDESMEFGQFLKNARNVLSNFEGIDNECQVPASNFKELDQAITAYKQVRGVSDSVYSSAMGNEMTCYNFRERLNQDYDKYMRSLNNNTSYSGYNFDSCSGSQSDPGTCASILVAEKIDDMKTKCQNSRANIKYENKIRLQVNSAQAINNLLTSAFQRLESPKCKGRFPQNMYKSLLKTTISAAGIYSSSAAGGVSSLLIAQGTGLINIVIDLFSKKKSYVESLQEESDFKDRACFYYEVKKRVFGCDKFDLAEDLSDYKKEYENAKLCIEDLQGRYLIGVPYEISSIFEILDSHLAFEDEKKNINQFQNFSSFQMRGQEGSDRSREAFNNRPYSFNKNQQKSKDELQDEKERGLDQIREHLDGIMENFDQGFDGNASFGQFIGKTLESLTDLSMKDDSVILEFDLNNNKRSARSKNRRTFKKFIKKTKEFSEIMKDLNQYGDGKDDNQHVEKIGKKLLKFHKRYPGSMKYHLKSFLIKKSKIKGNGINVISLYEGYLRIINNYEENQRALNKGVGRESSIVMNGMMAHMPLLFKNRLKELGESMRNIHHSKNSELKERSYQFETYIKPLVKTCLVLSSAGALNSSEGSLNAGTRVLNGLHREYQKYCAPFFCADGEGLKVFARPKMKLENIPPSSIIRPECSPNDEQCIIQHYKKISCNEDKITDSLVNDFEDKYERQGKICGKFIKNTTEKRPSDDLAVDPWE